MIQSAREYTCMASSVAAQFGGAYQGRTVLVTGHTGFKGSWLALWLRELGARVVGYALPPETDPNHIGLLDCDLGNVAGDVRDRQHLAAVMAEHRPDVVFHLAAQPLVRRSYRDPAQTLEANVLGTVNLYEVCRSTPSVRAVVSVTSDKVYENQEWTWGYREIDRLGGHDPYSCSKACVELVTSCYRNCFFNPRDYGRSHQLLLASARAGNVIGGGDWSEDRIVPDLVKATARDEKVVLRSPRAVRPWQHVLEPLSGYLYLGQKLLEGHREYAEAWNFGPEEGGAVEVECLVRQFQQVWPRVRYEVRTEEGAPHEAGRLMLDCSKARVKIGWFPVWDWADAVAMTASWYRDFYESGTVPTRATLHRYWDDASQRSCVWSR